MTAQLLKSKTLDQQADTLASFMPSGKPFTAMVMENSNMRNMLLGLAVECKRAEDLINHISYDFDINVTTSLLTDWERALGLPDHCFDTDIDDIDQRRAQVLVKLSASVQTSEDFIALTTLLDLAVITEIESGTSIGIFPFTGTFPIMLMDHPQSARFTSRISLRVRYAPSIFPLELPYKFTKDPLQSIVCLLQSISPANVRLLYQYVLTDLNAISLDDSLGFLLYEDSGLMLLD